MLNVKAIKEQVKELVKGNNKGITIPVNEIVGIDQYNELVYIENISLAKYSDNTTLDVDGMTFRKVTVRDVEQRRSEDWAEEERDIWVEMARAGRIDDDLYDWWEQACDEAEAEGLLYPFDDDSYRSLIENKYEELSKAHKDKIKEEWGIKGNPYKDIDDEVNQNSDWLTVYCGSSGGTLTMYRHCSYNHYEKCVEQLADWKVCLYPELIKFLMKTIDKLEEENNKQKV